MSIWSRSQSDRSWSASRTISPSRSVRAARRESCRSISASSPAASGSSGSIATSTSPEPDRLGAQLARISASPERRDVALVEDQVERPRAPPSSRSGSSLGVRHLVRDPRVADLALRADEALRHRRLGDQEGAGDLRRRQAAERAQGERDPRLRRERRVAAGEDQPQAVVGELVGVTARSSPSARAARARPASSVFASSVALAAQAVDRAVAGDARDPGAGIVRHAVARPALEGDDEGVLDRLLGEVEVAEDADQGRDRPSRLAPEQAVERPFANRYDAAASWHAGHASGGLVVHDRPDLDRAAPAPGSSSPTRGPRRGPSHSIR